MRAAFLGFGEVNTPPELIIEKCKNAENELLNLGANLLSVYPITDDSQGNDVNHALDTLKGECFDALILCIAGWIPSHAVIKIADAYRDTPMVLWGLCGRMEGNRLVTTADQAGTSALRGVMQGLGYRFKYVYEIIDEPSRAHSVLSYVAAAGAAKALRSAKIGMGGYRDMNLYGTLYDGISLKKTFGTEIETFELLELANRAEKTTMARRAEIVSIMQRDWHFLAPAKPESLESAAKYYLAVSDIARERGYSAISLKDVDGMKALLGFPPAPVFMLLADLDGICTIPENDSLGALTQLLMKNLTLQCAPYLEFYEFMTDRVLAGVPDYIPRGATKGETRVMPAAFGALSEGILNVSEVITGELSMSRIFARDTAYALHTVRGVGLTPRKWEEAGWTQPAPQLPGLEILLEDTARFAQNVMCQHYIITFGDESEKISDLCSILSLDILK